MSEKTQQATDLLGQLSSYLEQAKDVIVKYGPDVWASTLTIIRIQSIFWLVVWTVTVLGASYALRAALREFAANNNRDSVDTTYWPIPVSMVSGFALAMSAAALALGGFQTLLGAFAPDLAVLYALAHKVGIL